jgi:putative transcriptional regulator
MNAVRPIRERLKLSQAQLADALGMTQGNVSFIELDKQPVMPDAAAKLIAYAQEHGLEISYDHVYGAAELPTEAKAA